MHRACAVAHLTISGRWYWWQAVLPWILIKGMRQNMNIAPPTGSLQFLLLTVLTKLQCYKSNFVHNLNPTYKFYRNYSIHYFHKISKKSNHKFCENKLFKTTSKHKNLQNDLDCQFQTNHCILVLNNVHKFDSSNVFCCSLSRQGISYLNHSKPVPWTQCPRSQARSGH